MLALIPARGGSKGIPRKNIMEIAGKPLIAWSIEHALESTHIDRVIVSTDDEEIADVARQWGAEVPFIRPAELAGDLSPDIEVFRHALEYLAQTEGYQPQIVAHLRPTGPIRRVEDIDVAIELLVSRPEVDAVRSVSLVHQSPYKMWQLRADGGMDPLLGLPGVADCQSLPRQNLPYVYWQNGYIDLIRPRAVLDKGSMWGDCVLPLIVEHLPHDLDYPEDIPTVAEALSRPTIDVRLAQSPPKRHSV